MLKSNAATLSKRFQTALGYWPNLEDPRTIQEKILWRKLFEDMSEATLLADKVAVRDYVRQLVGEQYLVKNLAIAETAEGLDFDAFPDSFVIKVNHASGLNIVVQERSKLDVPAVRRTLKGLLRLQYGRRLGEHWYAAIGSRVIVEELLVDQEHGLPIDYKFNVFHGRTEFITVHTGARVWSESAPDQPKPAEGSSYVDRRQTQYTTLGPDWKPAPFHYRTPVPQTPVPIDRPAAADEMIALAEKLAGDWGFVRVDLYCLNGEAVYFGEMTFAPGSGLDFLVPEHYNEYLGSLWDITRRYVRAP